MKNAFDVEEKKGYVKCSNGSVQLTGLDGREAINLTADLDKQEIVLTYHGNEIRVDAFDLMPKSTLVPLRKYIGEEPIGKGAISKPVFEDGIKYKYAEDRIIADFKAYVDSTYGEHYKASKDIEVLDAWLALGSFITSCRDVAIKYLWRYGKKDGSLKKDLFKAMHYTLLMMYGDHYRDD